MTHCFIIKSTRYTRDFLQNNQSFDIIIYLLQATHLLGSDILKSKARATLIIYP